MNKLMPLFAFVFLFTGCKKDESNEVNDPIDPINTVIYELSGVTNSNITGQATFTRNEDNSTTVFIRLSGASDLEHPASIHYNSASEGGGLAITLNSCECLESETLITEFDNGNPIDFDEMMSFDGHINIFESIALNDVIIAQVDIGSNDN